MKKLMIVFAIAALAFASCDNLTSPPQGGPGNPADDNPGVPIKAGEGLVTLSIAEENASLAPRSVMPSSPSFTKYEITFQCNSLTGGGTLPADTTDTITSTTYSKGLAPGSWTISVKGYIQDLPEVAAATGTATVTVTAGTSATATITISAAAITASGNGMFTWTIGIPSVMASGDSAQFTLTKNGTAVSGFPKDLKTAANRTGAIELAAGYYEMKILLTKGGKMAGAIEEVHIYPGLKTELKEKKADGSKLDYSFTDGDFSAAVNIAGTVAITKPGGTGGIAITSVDLKVYNDSARTSIIGQTSPTFAGTELSTTSAGGTSSEWVITVPSAALPPSIGSLWWTLTAMDSDGNTYSAQSYSSSGAIPENGITLGAPTATDRSLTIYSIRVGSLITQGRIDRPPAATADTLVTMTVVPSQGYLAPSDPVVKRTDTDPYTVIPLTKSGSRYTFTMPPSGVSISMENFVSTNFQLNSVDGITLGMDLTPSGRQKDKREI